ncbi:hypothetical protein [Mycobacteroides salmoniphilum]|uniref:Uncharacterized protein n=1 Tax=Mycobacteroides salmoniphilum TaxID=404941 RepID=A0A4R8SZT1_9MYCO|nr:hypothetical protein [Mycobacteroides salmoniphilum]TEA09112.1 hypothetical protein CCUG60884_00281 [Mycobacteroides salmoniphilum]
MFDASVNLTDLGGGSTAVSSLVGLALLGLMIALAGYFVWRQRGAVDAAPPDSIQEAVRHSLADDTCQRSAEDASA